MIIETKEGLWVIDHKSDAVEDGEKVFESYRPQLTSYAFALAAQGQNVLGVAINWIRRSEVILMKLDIRSD